MENCRIILKPLEEKRISRINEKAQERTATFFKKYQENAPHTTRYFEEKIIDYIIGKAKVNDKIVSVEELYNFDEENKTKKASKKSEAKAEKPAKAKSEAPKAAKKTTKKSA